VERWLLRGADAIEAARGGGGLRVGELELAGETSDAPASAVQLLSGRAGLVATSTPNVAPTVLVKANWNARLVSMLCS